MSTEDKKGKEMERNMKGMKDRYAVGGSVQNFPVQDALLITISGLCGCHSASGSSLDDLGRSGRSTMGDSNRGMVSDGRCLDDSASGARESGGALHRCCYSGGCSCGGHVEGGLDSCRLQAHGGHRLTWESNCSVLLGQ